MEVNPGHQEGIYNIERAWNWAQCNMSPEGRGRARRGCVARVGRGWWWCGLSAGARAGLRAGWVWPVLGYLGTHQHCHQHMTSPGRCCCSRAHSSMTRWYWVLSASVCTKCHFIGSKSCSPVKLIEIQWDTDRQYWGLLSFGPPEASITWVVDLEWTLWPSASHLAAQSEDICDVVDVYFLQWQWLPAAGARKFKFNIKLHVWASHSSQVSKGATFLWLNHVILWSSVRVVATFAKHASSFHTMNYWKLWCEESHKISDT